MVVETSQETNEGAQRCPPRTSGLFGSSTEHDACEVLRCGNYHSSASLVYRSCEKKHSDRPLKLSAIVLCLRFEDSVVKFV